MNKNKGFSLVELIVAIAIFAIAGVAVFGFTVYSSNNYSRTNTEVKLQYEQQLVVNQIRDAILEASKGIYYDEAAKSLFIYSEKTDAGGVVTYPVTKISFRASDMKMFVAKGEFANVADINLASLTDDKLLAESVKDFSVDLSKVKKDKVTFSITFSIKDKDVSVSPVIALRNHLQVTQETDTIYSGTKTEVLSFIKSIQIVRGSQVFTQGAVDTIGKTDAAQVVTKYSAIVTTTQDSTKTYKVEWSLSPEITGVTIGKDTGIVTVAHSVPENKTFTLTATSVDDPTKYASITVKITGGGVYPKKVVLTDPPVYDKTGNGFWRLEIAPTITYTDNSTSTDVNKLDWEGVGSLPDGCRYWLDEDKNVLVLSLTDKANGKTFTVYAKTKDSGADGNPVKSNEVKIVIGPNDIKPYVSGPILNVAAPSNFERGGFISPGVSWQNATSSNYTYYWTIEPYQDDSSAVWNNADNTKTSFNNIYVLNSNCSDIVATSSKITCKTEAKYRNITLKCSPKLDWSKVFKYKISVRAVNNKDNTEVFSKEEIGSIQKVTLKLTPINKVKNENNIYPISNTIQFQDSNSFGWTYNTRWFITDYDGLFINGGNTIYNLGGSTSTANVARYYGGDNKQIFPWNSNDLISGNSYTDRQSISFTLKLSNLEYQNPRPEKMTYFYKVWNWTDGIYNEVYSEPLDYYLNYNH